MSELVVRFSGQFQLWGYTVSHGQLLLRSTRSELRPTQIDVLFKNVGYIQLPVLLEDPEVTLSEAAVKDSLNQTTRDWDTHAALSNSVVSSFLTAAVTSGV